MNIKKKSLAVAVILLFIGVAVAPSINFRIAKAASDNELIEVTTEACGIKGFGNTTVKLTKQQYQNLEQYLVDFRERMNQTTTREEAVPIFKEAVVELNKYGLLPKGMGVEKALRLVVGFYQVPKNNRLLDVMTQKNTASNNVSNIFCLVNGESNTVFIYEQGAVSGMITKISFILFKILRNFGVGIFWGILHTLIYFCSWYYWTEVYNFSLGTTFYFGEATHYTDGHWLYRPDNGYIHTLGLFGAQNFTGTFYGNILALPGFYINWYGEVYNFPGIIGFTGLSIRTIIDDYPYINVEYFGSAIAVKITTEQPIIP